MRKLLLVFLLLSTLSAQMKEHYFWKKVSFPGKGTISFLAGKTKDNLWIQSRNTVVHIDNLVPKINVSSQKEGFINTEFFQITDEEYFCCVITTEWESDIYKIKNNKWESYNLNSEIPIKHIYKTNDSTFYAIGDFGLLLKYANNKWKKIKTPFKSHIVIGIVFNNLLYLSTSTGGIFIYDGKTLLPLSRTSENDYIIEFKIINSMLYGKSIHDNIYSFNNNVTKRISDNYDINYFLQAPPIKFGFSNRRIQIGNISKRIEFPQNYNINEIKVLDDNTIILFSRDGKLYFSQNSSESHFDNFAALYRVDDSPNSNTNAAQFFDANNDGIQDLITLNNSYDNYLSLLRGVSNSSFANITSISNIPFINHRYILFAISDFNKDELPDIVFESIHDSLYKLSIFINEGDFSFNKTDEISLPDEFQRLGVSNLNCYDYDNDGDKDIILTSYYGEKNKHGHVLIYQNNYWGNFDKIDSIYKPITHHWNKKFIFADVNNDDTLDAFNTTFWTNDHLFIGSKTGLIERTKSNFLEQKKTETLDALLFDYDNDGDLDIITSGKYDFLRIYENDGKGKYSEKTDSLFPIKYLNNRDINYISSLNIGDFNNDGYSDILTSYTTFQQNKTLLLLNNKGKFFSESILTLSPINDIITKTSLSDFDMDGDLDIFGATPNRNVLLINNLNNNNFLELKLKGVISPTIPLGSKVWIYKAEKLDSSSYLLGYKELGTENYGTNWANDNILHFGLGDDKQCDIIVRFPSGEIKTFSKIAAGTILEVSEVSSSIAFIYKIPGRLYRFFKKRDTQIYIAVLFISHLILFLGLWIGYNKLNWTLKITSGFALLNYILFWISLLLSSYSLNEKVKFITPVLIILVATIIPLILFFWLNRNDKKNLLFYNDKLLELVMAFSHGEWALRNLNSIILLCDNPPSNWKSNIEFQNKLKTRCATFNKMTLPYINEIVEYEKLISKNIEEVKTLSVIANESKKLIDSALTQIATCNLSGIVENFTNIRTLIRDIRNITYSNFSSKPTEVINNLISNYNDVFDKEGIVITKKKRFPIEIPVLIKGHELGDIIDNLIQNSVRFLKTRNNKHIRIEIAKESPKIVIAFSNNGEIIPKDKWETIFEQGYSERGSTGQGLYFAREKLKKYGGAIFVHTSTEEETIFKIELNEGVIND